LPVINKAMTGLTRWGCAALAGGLALSVLAACLQSHLNRGFTQQAVTAAVQQASEQIVNRLQLYQYGLRGARGAVLTAGEQQINQATFRRYSQTRSLAQEFPGARGFGFIRRVPHDQLDAWLRRVRTDQGADFAVKLLSEHSGEHYMLELFEPAYSNESAMGLDIASEKNRREAALAALVSNQPRLTAPITLVQEQGKPEQSFLILLPVYRTAAAPDSAQARLTEGFGWTFAPLLMEDVIGSLHLDDGPRFLRLTDITSEDNRPVLYDTQGEFVALASAIAEPEVFGRRWRVELSVSAPFVKSLHLLGPSTVLVTGAVLSLLLAALLSALELGRLRRRQTLAAQALMASIVESSTDAIITCSLDGRITSWNEGAERMLGHSARQALGQALPSLLVPDALLREERATFDEVRQGRSVQLANTQRRHRDGQLLDVSLSVSPIKDDAGRVIGASKSLRDTSAQKAAEAQVRELNAHLEELVSQRTQEIRRLNALFTNVLRSSSEVSIIATDLEGIITVFNRGAERMLGYNAAELVGSATPAVLHLESEIEQRCVELAAQYQQRFEGFRALVYRTVVEGSDTQEWTYVRKDGSQLPVSLVITAMRDELGTLTGYLGIAVDVTAQHALEAGLTEAKNLADAASAAKSYFLANMSHEIRTPMNAVLGMLQLIHNTPLNPRQQDYVAKAQSAAKSLLGILNDILDYSKIEAGKLQIDAHPFELEALMQDLAVVLAGNETSGLVEVAFDLDPSVPAHLIGDSLRLQQILINLGGNALKFTQKGQVVVNLQALGRNADEITVRVSVNDTGIGIDAHQLERIFEGFSQAEPSTSRRFGGTGLGLVISRRLLNLMHSDLHVQSQLGVGSRFWFDITLGIGQQQASVPTDELLGLPVRVLVVDDNEIAAHILLRTLQGFGWHAEYLAHSSQAAARVLSAQQAGLPYDVVLMDWKMPGYDGLATARDIRRQCVDFPAPGIVMVTAYAKDVLDDAQEAGDPPFLELLTKPVTPRQIYLGVQKALRVHPDALPDRLVEPPPTAMRLSGVRLLVVEDNALNRFVALELLRREGALVQLAEGGLEALTAIEASSPLFDLVLMDVQMPDLDGLEVTRRLRREPRWARLPIVAMTANASVADREACLLAGMDDHIGKPIDINHVVEVVRRHLPATLLDSLDQPLPGLEAANVIFDRFGGDRHLFQGALAYFHVEIEELLGRLQQAVAEIHQRQAADVLHSIKGCAATMGAQALAATAGHLEPRVRALPVGMAITSLVDLQALQDLARQSLAELDRLAQENWLPAS
jgi:PAS domain S-box-containing protein